MLILLSYLKYKATKLKIKRIHIKFISWWFNELRLESTIFLFQSLYFFFYIREFTVYMIFCREIFIGYLEVWVQKVVCITERKA